MVWKRHLTPLGRKGRIDKHSGKGSQMAAMPERGQIDKLAKDPMTSINDYAKATPMPEGVPSGNDDNGA